MTGLNPLEAMQAMQAAQAMQQQPGANPMDAIAQIAEVPALLVRVVEALEKQNELLTRIDVATSKAGEALDGFAGKTPLQMLTGR